MPHDVSLISTVAVGLAFAFVGGFAAVRLGLPPIVGYLLAGVAIGLFTPGYVADKWRACSPERRNRDIAGFSISRESANVRPRSLY